MAAAIRRDGHRHPVSEGNPFLHYERVMSSFLISNLEAFGKARETWTEALFHSVYGSPVLQAAVGLSSDRAKAARRASGSLQGTELLADLEAEMDRGGLLEAGLRALIYVLQGGGVDERQFNALERIYEATSENREVTATELKTELRRQAKLVIADASRAIAAIPGLLPKDPGRCAQVVAVIETVAGAKGALDPQTARRLTEIRKVFGLGRKSSNGK
jgi:hypothetical protein